MVVQVDDSRVTDWVTAVPIGAGEIEDVAVAAGVAVLESARLALNR